jgi:hypothetical protein
MKIPLHPPLKKGEIILPDLLASLNYSLSIALTLFEKEGPGEIFRRISFPHDLGELSFFAAS